MSCLVEYAGPRSYLQTEHGVETYDEARRALNDLLDQQAKINQKIVDVTAAIVAVWPASLPVEPAL